MDFYSNLDYNINEKRKKCLNYGITKRGRVFKFFFEFVNSTPIINIKLMMMLIMS